jgi:hypothetical protein
MPIRVAIYAAVLLIVTASPVHAWNSLGHKVVAESAWRQLDPTTRQSIVDTLRRHPRFDIDFVAKMEDDAVKGDKETQDHWIFQHAATWPDQIRKNKEYVRPEWHYIDLPLFLEQSDAKAFADRLPVNISTEYPGHTPIDKMNIVQAIEHCRKALRGKAGPDVKAIAYCWLFHLVGDIHQPLHCTGLFSVEHFPKSDEGGNKILLARCKNLHSLWDNLLGRDSKMSGVNKATDELMDHNRFGDVWDSAANETDPKKWAEESRTQCENYVYSEEILAGARTTAADGKMSPIELPEVYYKMAGEHARRRVVAAGLRLAKELSPSRP